MSSANHRRPRQSGRKLANARLRSKFGRNFAPSGHISSFEYLEDRRLLTVVPFQTLANDLRGDLQGLETRVVNALNGFATGENSSLPFVGDQLGSAARAISGFSQQVYDAMAALGAVNDPSPALLQNALFNTLGPAGLNLLADRGSNGITAADILINAPGGSLSSNFSVDMRLRGGVAGPSTPLTFDTGLPGLPLKIETNGAIGISVNFDYELAFSYDAATQSISLDDTKRLSGTDNQLAFAVNVGLQSFSATATMGFVQGSLTTLPGETNGVTLAVGLKDLNSTPDVKVSGTAEANLQLDGSFAGTDGDFPGIDASLHLYWAIDSENPSAAPPEVSIENVYLDLGKFLSNVVKPVFEKIHIFTQPLSPILEVLGYPLPGLSDLSRLAGGDDVDLLDLGGIAALVTGFGPLYDLVHKVLNVIDKLNDFEIGDSVRMKLGGFDLADFDLRNMASAVDPTNLNVRNLTDLSPSNLVGIAQSLAQKVDELPLSDEEKELIKGFAEQLNNGFSIQFPILEHPESAVFPLLLGRDSDLFTLEAEMHVSAQGSVATGYSFFGVGIEFGGEVEIDTKFKFAYDTFGLRTLINDLADGNTSAETIAEDILAGFYVGSDSYFKLAGNVYAGAGASIGVFSAVVGGFISTQNSGNDPVSVSIIDPNQDGKLRFTEFGEDSLNLEGKFSAALGIQVRIGVEVFGKFVGIKKRFDIAEKVLVNFDDDVPDPEAPILASQPDVNGNIKLYVGALAGERRNVNQTNGNERLRIQHVETTANGETLDITFRETFLGLGYDVTQRIFGVRSISGIGDQGDLTIDVLGGVTSDVHFEGGLGHADFIYDGTGTAYLEAGDLDSYLAGGLGNNTLIGLGGNDTIALGHAGNVVTGAGGSNTIIVTAPTTQGGAISGGDTLDNQLVVISGEATTNINLDLDSPGAIRLAYNELTGGPYPNLILTRFNTVTVTAQDRATNIHIGELSGAGVQTVFVNVPVLGDGGRTIDLDTRIGLGLSDISLQPFAHSYTTAEGETVLDHAMVLTNATTGVTTYLMGVAKNDITTIVQHGGTATVGPLSNDNGTIVFDTSSRPPGQSEVVFMQTPAIDGGNHIVTSDGDLGSFVLDADLYPTIKFRGLASIDTINLDVTAPGLATGINTVYLDASSLAGKLDVDLLGAGSLNQVTISQLASAARIDVDGLVSDTLLTYGVGVLADILGDVQANNVELTVDNKNAVITSQLLISDTELQRRSNPDDGRRPAMTYTGLHGNLTVHAGAGDRLGLNQTPTGIDGAYFTNPSQTLDSLYVTAASANLGLDGNWSLYLGRALDLAGNVTRTSRLTPIGVHIGLNFEGDNHTEIILDAALDPVGAVYAIHGLGFVVENQTVGLVVSAVGLALSDDVKLYLTGATVNVTLPFLAPATITVDGNDRFTGANPTGSNAINVEVPIGGVTLNPVGQYDSVLLTNDPIYILGSMPQDKLNISIATSTTISPNVSNPAVVFGYGSFISDANYVANNPLLGSAWAIGTGMIFYDSPVNLASFYEAIYPSLGGSLPYSLYTNRTSGSLSYQQVYLNPNSHYDPPLPIGATSGALFFQVNQPSVNSQMQMNASQLRGQLNINVKDPDYYSASPLAYFFNRLTEHIYQPGGSQGYTEVSTPGPRFNVAFGQTYVNLTHVGLETTASVQGVNKHPQSSNVPFYGELLGGVITDPRAYVNVGAGDLSNIQGVVNFNTVELTIDGRYGTQEDILQLDGSSFSGWGTGAPGVSPTATLGTLVGPLTIYGGVGDSFSILNTPAGATAVSIVNSGPPAPAAASMAMVADQEPVAESLAVTATTPRVYVAGKRVNQTLSVSGNFELYVGRRLNLNGTVDPVTDISSFTNLEAGVSAGPQQNILYNFTGEGLGKLVYDISSYAAVSPNLAIQTDAAYPGKGELAFKLGNALNNRLVYSPNTDLHVYGPYRTFFNVENTTTATVRFFANPLADQNYVDTVQIGAALGPVYITGRGNRTLVSMMPTQFSANDLRSTILADVYLSNVALRIAPDTSTSPLPSSPNAVLLTSNQLTGLTGGVIHFEQLQNLVNTPFSSAGPGLQIGMPRNGASSLTIANTPSGVTTQFLTVDNAPLGSVSIQGTTGTLSLGPSLVAQSPLAISDLTRREFRAASVTVGNGTLQAIQGDIYFASVAYVVPGGTVFDNHAAGSAEVRLGGFTSETQDFWAGLAPARLYVYSSMAAPLTILDSPGSHYEVNRSPENLTLMAGEGTTVDLLSHSVNSAILPWGMSIYGAEQVTLTAPQNISAPAGKSVHIYGSPDRPSETTEVIADFTMYAQDLYLDNAGGGIGEIWSGNQFSKLTILSYQGDTTRLTVLGIDQEWGMSPTSYPLRVLDTVALSTSVNPGNRMIEVRGATQPITVEYDGKETIVLGNAGNMQSIRGHVTINVHDAPLANVTIQLNNSADATARNVLLGQPSSIDWTVSGLAPGSIQVHGARSRLAVLAGSGNNTLVGPNTQTAWNLTSAGAGTVNSTLTFAGMPNLTGGTASDDFYFRASGQLTGNLNGGDGTDTVHYVSVLDGSETIDLPAGVLPLVGGVASNIEFVDVVTPVALQNPGNQIGKAGVAIAPLQILTTGGVGTKTFSATGLPTGLSIDSATGVVSGTISAAINPGTVFNSNVTVSDETGTKSVAFSWTVQLAWSVASPGDQTLFEGVPISLQIPFSNPDNLPLTFLQSGLPASLYINEQTGEIAGTIYFYNQNFGRDFTFPVTITAYDGARGQSITFNLSTRSGFQVSASNRSNLAGSAIDLDLVYNPYLHDISVVATGLPPGLSVDANGHIVGTIDHLAFQNSPFQVEFTATNHTIGYTVTQQFVWDVSPSVAIYSPGDRTTYSGIEINLPLTISNELEQEISVEATGLPAGLSIDDHGVITGVITPTAASDTPYQVTVTVTNLTVGFSVQTSFAWTVLPPLSLDNLNANTPPGTPILTGILDPAANPSPQDLTAITFSSLPNSPTYIYFVSNDKLWVFNGETTRPVQPVDPLQAEVNRPYDLIGIPGRGVVFYGDDSQLWFADATGMQVIAAAPFYGDHNSVALVGDSLYLVSYDPSDFSQRISRISFSPSGQATHDVLPLSGIRSITSMSSFAGGLLYVANLASDFVNQHLQWYDPATGIASTLASTQQFGPVTVTTGASGTQTAFFYKKPTWNTNVLAAINSAALGQPNPQATDLQSFGTNVIVGEDYSSWQPLLADGDRLVFSATTTVNDVTTVQFWTSDGTVVGTTPLGQPVDPHGYFRDQALFAGNLYFISQPQAGDGSDTSPAGRLYKLDLGAGVLTLLNEFFGGDNYSALSYQRLFVADHLYFAAMSPDKSRTALWRLGPTDDTASYVPAKPTNVYASPDLQNAVYAGGQLYFPALAHAILSPSSQPTTQVWRVGAPGAVQVPGDLDGDGIVTASDIDSIWGLIQAGDTSADLNHDGEVDQADLDYLIRVILNTEYGDVNLDGFVDASDLAETRKHVGQVFSGPNWAQADFNGDGRSDAADLAIVRRYSGFAASPAAPLASATAATQPAPNAPVVAQPAVALAEGANQRSAFELPPPSLHRAAKPATEEPSALSILVGELDDLTDIIAKATAARRRRSLI